MANVKITKYAVFSSIRGECYFSLKSGPTLSSLGHKYATVLVDLGLVFCKTNKQTNKKNP